MKKSNSMRISLFLLFFLLNMGSLISQSNSNASKITSIYKITDAEAEEFFQTKNQKIDDRYFHTFVDTFSKKIKYKSPPKGYYLFVRAINESLDVTIKDYNTISVTKLNNFRDLTVQVIDSSGNIIEDGEVFFGKKKLKYVPKIKAYQKKRVHKGGFLKVKANGETVFYEVYEKDNLPIFKKRYRRFARSKVGWIATTPFRWGGKSWQFLKNGIRNHYWEWGIFQRRKKDKSHKGYIAFNQPKYQPGDTVKVKGYFTNHKGKPLTKKLDIRFRGNRYGGKSFFSIPLQPISKGAYAYEFVLGDSLTLDRNYYVDFWIPNKKRDKKIMSHYFYYEDYQLDEVEYFLKTTQPEYGENEKIILLAEGKDKNGWTIPDGQIKFIAKSSSINNFYKKEVLIPDTLWEHQQVLDVSGETQILFPKEKLPNAEMTIHIFATFTNSNGELQEENTTFIYDPKKIVGNEKIEVKLDGEFVVATYLVDSQSVEKEGILWLEGDENKVSTEQKIKFPFKERLNPFVMDYDFEAGDAEGDLYLEDKNMAPNVYAFGTQTKDSILITFSNPHRLPITYQLRSKNKLIQDGQSDEKNISINLKSKRHKSVFLYYQYVFADRSYELKQPVHFYKNLLSIKVEQPKTVTPGEQVQFKVKVKTAKNKPAKNVNIVAGAVNSQFDNLKNIKEPRISFKATTGPLEFDRFDVEEQNANRKRKNISQKWYDELELDSLLFYQIRYPKNGVLAHYDTINSVDTFYQDVAQFAPYLVKDGKIDPIYLIYCNRQLVYYYDVDNNPPYSFVGREGLNSIIIRTRDFLYQLENVELKKGQKLELSIDANNFTKSIFSKNISRKTTTKELTVAEKELLNRRIFILRNPKRNKNIYVWQDYTNVNQFSSVRYRRNREIKMGPFYSNQKLNMLIQDGWSNTFKFEPRFIYEVEKNRERLYESKFFSRDRKMILPKSIPLKRIGEIVRSPNDIKIKTPFFDRLTNYFTSSRNWINAPYGNYKFNYGHSKTGDSTLFAIVLLQNDSLLDVFRPQTRQIKYLQPNNYTVILFTPKGDFYKKEITIQANHLLYQDLRGATFVRDTSRAFFNKIFLEFSDQRGQASEAQLYFSKNNNSTGDENKFDIPTFGSLELSGIITDDSGETLIGATVIVKQNGQMVTGTSTDINGEYRIILPEGIYSIEVSYTGYSSVENHNIKVDKNGGIANISLDDSGMILSEVVVTGYAAAAKRSLSGVVTSEEIRSLPTRNINAVAASTAGAMSIDDGDAISIKGSRANATDYYIDGIRVSGDLLPESEIALIELRSKFADYAYFNPNLITDENGEAYFSVTFPDNITAWKTYVVGMDHKLRGGTDISEIQAYKKMTAQLALPRFLVEGDEVNIIGKAQNFTQDSFDITSAFKIEDEILKSNQSELKTGLVEKAKIATPANVDSLTLSYLVSSQKYNDGEKRSIPVFQKGVEETSGVFKVLDDLPSFSTRLNEDWGPVKLRIENNILEVLMDDLKYLRNYPYGCNEQTASRLIALLLEKDLKKLLGEKFDGEKEIIRAIKRLKITQNKNGSWGWWQNGNENIWMTTYVLNALQKAAIANYKTEALNQGLIFLTNRVEELDGKKLLDALLLFSDISQNIDYEKYLTKLDSTQNSIYDKFAIAKIRQANDLPIEMDSLLQYEKKEVFGGIYFGEDNYRWYNNSSQISLLAYDIFKKNNDSERAKKIQRYFLSRRNKNGWRNTIVTTKVLLAFLPDLMEEQKGFEKIEVRISGAIEKTVSEFPFEAVYSNDQPLNITKIGTGPVFITAYQQYWNRTPKEKSDVFSIKTHLTQEGKKTDDLEAAVAADLVVEVEVKQTAEYVMIEIPIPAGCSYQAKPNARWNVESHREYFKNRTAIFCANMPVGKYTFTIPLEPRFSGKYTLNPTKAEQMYFPVFYGRNGMKELKIEN